MKKKSPRTQIKELKAKLDFYVRNNVEQIAKIQKLESELKESRNIYSQRVADRMLNERAQVLQALGNITESLSKAIVMTVGKEVI